MRTLFATATALTIGLALTSGVRADDKDKNNDNKDTQTQGTHSQTIHGIVAGVTVEGETAVDYQTNKAVMLEAAYLTVVGMPGHGHHGNADHKPNAAGADSQNADKAEASARASSGGRHNVYLVWLSPRTKVCEAKNADGEKKECSLDKLEVGDRVEIQMTRRDESGNNQQGAPSEAMRKKHGRNRIYVGDATEITILAAPRGGQAGAQAEANANSSNDSDDKNKESKDENRNDKNDN